jgi:hypothetical protein
MTLHLCDSLCLITSVELRKKINNNKDSSIKFHLKLGLKFVMYISMSRRANLQ